MTIIEKVKFEYPYMTKSERELSAYLLANINEFSDATLKYLAEANNTSTTTIIRYARRLGFNGFKEFQQSLRSSTNSVQPTLVNKFHRIAEMSNDHLLSNTINHNYTCIEETFDNIPPEKINKCMEMITKARRVYTFGLKESFALAHYAYTRFYTVRQGVFMLNASNGDIERLLELTKEDVVLVFAFHRYTKMSLEILNIIKKLGIPIILVTNPPYEEIGKGIDLVLPCVVHGLGIKNTSIAPICLLDYLCNIYATNNPETTLQRFKKIEMLLDYQSTLAD